MVFSTCSSVMLAVPLSNGLDSQLCQLTQCPDVKAQRECCAVSVTCGTQHQNNSGNEGKTNKRGLKSKSQKLVYGKILPTLIALILKKLDSGFPRHDYNPKNANITNNVL